MTAVQQPNISLRRPAAASAHSDYVDGSGRRNSKPLTAPYIHHVQVGSSANSPSDMGGRRLSSPNSSAPYTHTVSVVPGIGRGIRSRTASYSLPGGMTKAAHSINNLSSSAATNNSSTTITTSSSSNTSTINASSSSNTSTINASSSSGSSSTNTATVSFNSDVNRSGAGSNSEANTSNVNSATITANLGNTTHTISLSSLSRSVFASNGRASQSTAHQNGRGRGRVVVRSSLPAFPTTEITKPTPRSISLSIPCVTSSTGSNAAADSNASQTRVHTPITASGIPEMLAVNTPARVTPSSNVSATTITSSSHPSIPSATPASVSRPSVDSATTAVAAETPAAAAAAGPTPVEAAQSHPAPTATPKQATKPTSPTKQAQCQSSQSQPIHAALVENHRLVNLGKYNATTGAMLMEEGQRVKFALPTNILQDIQTGNLYGLILDVTPDKQTQLDDVLSRIRDILIKIEDRLSQKNEEMGTLPSDSEPSSTTGTRRLSMRSQQIAYSREELLALYSSPLSHQCPAISKITNTIVEDKPIGDITGIVMSVRRSISQ